MAAFLLSGKKSSGKVGTLPLGMLHEEVMLSLRQFDGYYIVRVVHYKEKTAIGHEFHALYLRKNDDPSWQIVLRIDRRPSTRKVASSSDLDTDDSISPMDLDWDYSQFHHISTTYCDARKPLTVPALCEVCAFIRNAAPVYSLVKATHCYWFCAAFLIRLRMLDYCTGLAERGNEYKKRGRCRGLKLISDDSVEKRLIASAVKQPPVESGPSLPAAIMRNQSPRNPTPPPSSGIDATGGLPTGPVLNSLLSVAGPELYQLPTQSSTPTPPLHAPVASPTPAQKARAPFLPAAVSNKFSDGILPQSDGMAGPPRDVASPPSGSLPTASAQSRDRQHLQLEWALSLNELVGHEGAVWSTCFSPNGGHIVSGSADHTIRIWDATTDERVTQVLRGHTGEVTSIAISPDGHRIASGSDDETVRIWNLETGLPATYPLLGHTNCVWSVAFSPDGLRIVSGSEDKSVRIWDAETGAALGEVLLGSRLSVQSVAWSPDESYIISGSLDRTICLWDVPQTDDSVITRFHAHTAHVNSVAFSPDGSLIVSGSDDETVRVWDVASGRAVPRKPLRGHEWWVGSVTFSPNGRWIASGSIDQTVRIWDSVWGGADIYRLDVGSEVNSVAWSPAGNRIAAGCDDGKIRVWRRLATVDHTGRIERNAA